MKKNLPAGLRIMDTKIRWIFLSSLLGLVLFLSVLYTQKKRQDATRSWVDLTNKTIRKLDTISILLSETESATRTYLVTKDTVWKSQLLRLQLHLNESVSSLRTLIADNSLLQTNLSKLQELCTEKENLQKELVSGTLSIPEQLEKMNTNGAGPQTSRAIKQLLGSIHEIEQDLLNSRILLNESSYKTSLYTALIGGVIAFLLVLAILFQLNKDIYRRKKAEEEVFSSEAKYRSLTENAGVVIYTTNEKGLITFANNQVLELTGYTAEELSDKHFSFLLSDTEKQRVVGFYVDQFQKKQAASNLEFLIHTKTGRHKWVEQSAQLLFDGTQVTGFQCMVKDITEKKLVEQELAVSETKRKENEYRLNAILDNSTALIYIKDLEGRYVMANKKFREFFNLSEGQVIGKTDYEIAPGELADHYNNTDAAVLQSLKPVESEEIIRTSKGNRNLLLLKFPLLTPDHVLIGVSGIATDVTENAEMRRQNTEALQKAESAQQIQEQFLANMSHEIRTPMNGIQGMTKLLLETPLSEEQKKFTNIISRSLNNLVVIVNNVLDFSNLKTGKLTLDSFAFDLLEILEEAKKYFEHPLLNKGLAFELKIDEAVPKHVKGDAFRLKQVLTNLVGNAIKFTEKGTIGLHVSVLRQTEQQTDICFSISDTGIGIAKDKLDTIFESFAQAEKNISSGYGGAGLGLTISKGLIDIQGGEISVKSIPGEGSVFRFHIPFGQTQNEEVLASQNDYTERLTGKRVLVVEDNQVNQRLIDFVLKRVNIVVELAANGKEAIALCEQKPPYDLIIMDLQMPLMDGYETTVYLRETLKLKTPIIAMTATALKEDQERSSKVGMNDFMIKPFDFNDLYSRMIRLLFNTNSQSRHTVPEDEITEPVQEKLFNLSLLQELEDNRYLVEVVSFFLDNAPNDIQELIPLLEEKNWEALYKKAHKIKGAAAMLQSTKLARLLASIETNARALTNLENIPQMVAEVLRLFEELEVQLRNELTEIKKEI